jgi:translation initiation factor 1
MTPKRTANSRPVYSSESGRFCPDCGKPASACSCGKGQQNRAAKDGIVRVGRETKGRKGKGVTIVHGLSLAGGELEKLAKELKAKCGAGGTLKQEIIEIQGDHRDVIVRLLQEKGFVAKRAGG